LQVIFIPDENAELTISSHYLKYANPFYIYVRQAA
jgi:hypothetical protein